MEIHQRGRRGRGRGEMMEGDGTPPYSSVGEEEGRGNGLHHRAAAAAAYQFPIWTQMNPAPISVYTGLILDSQRSKQAVFKPKQNPPSPPPVLSHSCATEAILQYGLDAAPLPVARVTAWQSERPAAQELGLHTQSHCVADIDSRLPGRR